MNLEYWVNHDFKIYMIHSPLQYSIFVREGFEELLDFKTDAAVLAQLKKQ